ncbi:MAG: sugar ABC transporter substrate-binding protein, partial [Pseudomonadota bacterium]
MMTPTFKAGAALVATMLGSVSLAQAQTSLTLWYHGAGNEVEERIINQIVSDFNASQGDWAVELEAFPQGS